ncbi:MAG TPA: DNA-binding protein [Candidatus Thermoplasmatota archaeon]|nr:DNA-binding protein [Candidatus Thermoplasmatota archaeon]
MDDLEAMRRRRLAELQAQQQKARAAGQDSAAQAQAEADQAAAEEAAIERFLQQILEAEARERLTRIRMSRPDFAAQVARQLVAVAQSGRLTRRLTDADLREVLVQLTPKDRDTTITRK